MDEIPFFGGAGNGEAGGKIVVRTGLALVHKGERVTSEEDSKAMAILALEDSGQEVHLHFPVEIEIRSVAPTLAFGDEVDRALDAVAQRIAGMA